MNRNHKPARRAQLLTGTGPLWRLILTTSLGVLPLLATGAETTIADLPLATSNSVQTKPNLMFILDDSGSMDSAYMPDDMSSNSRFGYWSAQCNGVAYDPTVTYTPPVMSTGVSYPNASFTAARDDGFDTSSSTVNLDGAYYYQYSGSQPKMGWTYTFSGVDTSTDFYKECKTSISSGSTVFTRVDMTASSTDAQNYANWYSYYRKRYLLMRTAMGRAISSLGSDYRVGFSTISDTKAVDGSRYFRDVKDFDATQKSNFYSSLYSSAPYSYTPLRAALSKAGRYYANKASGQTYDPMQYACQRNYTLLSTDGYWNTDIETSSYGPFIVNANTNVGDQDGSESRPMLDAASTVTTKVTPYTTLGYREKTSVTTPQTRTLPWTRNMTTYTLGGGSCSASKYRKATYKQTYTQTQTQYFVTEQQATYSYSVTDTYINGLLSSTSTSTPTTGSWTTKTGTSTTATTTDTGGPTGTTTYTTASSPSSSSCVTTPSSTTYTTATAGSWSSWSPSSVTYTYTTPTVGTYVAGTPSSTNTTIGGVANTLADVAEYYWSTDLRKSVYGNCTSTSSGTTHDVCENVVTAVGADTNTAQHMVTYTIGLGTNGTLKYDKDYLTQTTGDYVGLKNGSKIWPEPGDGIGAPNIDDLWHAAVNGRGRYYSAMSATDLNEAISSVLDSVQAVEGAAAAAATTTLELVSGDNNKLFSASYTTQKWTGDLKAYTLNGSDGTISTDPSWSAQSLLDARSYDDRKIYFNSSSALTLLTYSSLPATLQAKFSNVCTSSLLSQCSAMTDPNKALANSGENLVNYLRGDRTYEVGKTVGLFRQREHLLGDIINGAPVYVGKPPFNYSDAGYASFVSTNSSRKPVVYVAANDGMLHAISAADSDGGTELWAFVPTDVMSTMYKLADSNYASQHRYFVDGAPVIGDIKVGSTWKTILVGGLNKGGKSYYAIDITNPASPQMLWEFTDANMGYTFGNPIITKRSDGTWVVAVTSGLNNTSGDGKGHLFLINAATGAKLVDLATSEGSSTTPSGLNKINAWIDTTTDNTALRFYGGDMLGNVWRFDTDGRYGTASAFKLAQLETSSTAPQPITTRPITVEVSGKPVVVVGTGRYMGDTDISDTQTQSLYAIRDTLSSTGWGDVRADTTNFTRQTLTASGTSATISTNSVDWTKGGWWVDLPHSGERVAINMALQLGTLAIGTAIPNGNACTSGGSSWLYYLNVATGGLVSGATDAGTSWSSNTLIVGMSYIKDSNGNLRLIIQDNKGKITSTKAKGSSSTGGGAAHRTSWRELVD